MTDRQYAVMDRGIGRNPFLLRDLSDNPYGYVRNSVADDTDYLGLFNVCFDQDGFDLCEEAANSGYTNDLNACFAISRSQQDGNQDTLRVCMSLCSSSQPWRGICITACGVLYAAETVAMAAQNLVCSLASAAIYTALVGVCTAEATSTSECPCP